MCSSFFEKNSADSNFIHFRLATFMDFLLPSTLNIIEPFKKDM